MSVQRISYAAVRSGLSRLLGCWLAVIAGGLVLASGALAQPSEHPFEIVPGSFSLTPSYYQAGAHADWTLKFDLAHEAGEAARTFNDLRSTVINYPTGFMGSANRFDFPTCTPAQLLGEGSVKHLPACPAASQVGTISFEITVSGTRPVMSKFPVYNMEVTSFGVTAELGFKSSVLTQLLPVEVRPGDSGVTGTSYDTKEVAEPNNFTLTIWGIPAAHEHDPERGRVCLESGELNEATCNGGGESAGVPARPFLANPTSCNSPLVVSMKADSWEEPQPADWFTETLVRPGPTGAFAEIGPFIECERIHFDPEIKLKPSTPDAESPTGLGVTLEVPQTWDEPSAIATSNVRDVSVTLPPGYTVNPSDGNGLAGCTPAEYAAETAFSAPACPPESKLGTVEIETPLLAQHIKGYVYLAQPYDNVPTFGDSAHPDGSLLALYVIAKEPQRGIVVKTVGKVVPDPVTGQLTSTFENLPQQPFSRVTFDLKQGVTSPLVSPPACGDYTAQATMTPSSAPLEPRLVDSSLNIEHGIGGGPCPAGGVPPLAPTVIAGTQNNTAGSYSPFYLRIVRKDGEQELTRFSTTLPPGLTGNLTGIPFCPEAAIEAARTATGAQELEHPSCPVASEVGHSIVGAGVGTVLAQTPGKVYLAGPYHGSPLSLVSVTSAKVGPFDLGTVVIRFGLNINPNTAQVEVSASSDAIPHIIDGIVVHVRDIRVYMDRPNFIINPTSCEHLQIQNTITGAGQDPANPADQVPFSTSTPFQAADCSNLQFKPAFSVTTTGQTSKTNGADLSVKLTMPGAFGTQANIHQVKVELPVQLPSRLTTLQKACTKAQFDTNPAGCPAASVVGHARAITPILPVPLEGPAYFVSNGSEAFPNLILVLQGYGITIDLVGDTFISKQGITSSTFKTVPDQPVTSFELTLPQDPNSALAANGNLCALTRTVLVKKKVTLMARGHKRTITRKVKQTLPATMTMPTEFIAQNGMTLHQTTPINVTGCPKTKPAAKKAAKSKKRPRRRG